jgi:hypothetical protein
MREPLLPLLLLQKRAKEEESATALQKAESMLQARVTRRQQAELHLSSLVSTQPNLGRQKFQELQRAEVSMQKRKEAEAALRQLESEELAAQQALSLARTAFTEAAKERKAIELAIQAEQRRIDLQREQKQEEEREEAWRTQRAQNTGDK